jgi:ABC-2 type transport system ATP-binding protein
VSTIIEGTGLEKTFVKKRSIRELITQPFRRAERIHALRGVDVQVREGEIFGLLGPNGAGKTTLLKIFSCLVLPDRGRATVGGRDTLHEYAVKKQIGLVNSDERSFYWRLSGLENLRFFAQLYDVPRRRVEDRVGELLERVDMAEAADRPFSGYSSGMKQRMAIARAMLHDPPILLMDEPTRSLDPAASLALRRFILTELRQREGKTIVLASHNLHEVEALADRVAILVKGRIRQIGTVPEVRRWGVQEQTFRLEINAGTALPAGPFRPVSEVTEDGKRRIVVSLDDGATLDDMLRALLDGGVSIRACDRIEPDLEQAFSRILEAEGGEE